MPWDLPEFERKRLEKGRRLLQDSEEHRGCRDLQLYVESLDLTVELHRVFLDDSGQRRQRLTAQEKLQGVVVFLRMTLCSFPAIITHCVMEQGVREAFKDAVAELRVSPWPWCGMMASLASAGFNSLQTPDMFSDILKQMVDRAAMMTSEPAFPPLTAAAEEHQRSAGFDPVLSAADMRLIALYTQQKAAHELLKRQPGASAAQQWLGTADRAYCQLLQLDPSAAACLQFKRGALMVSANRRSEAVAAFRTVLREASEHKSHVAESMAAQQLIPLLVSGFGGPRWNVEEVRGLLRTAKTALAKCKWMPPDGHAKLKDGIADTTRNVEASAARHPGAAMVPAVVLQPVYDGKVDILRCSGCEQQTSSLKKCSSCGVAAYCSRACQVRHWKQGGHKQECAQLAAGGSGSGAYGSSSRG